MLFFLLGCATTKATDTAAFTHDSAPTDDSAGHTDTDSGPAACPASVDTVEYVVDTIAVGTEDEGFDLDGDGDVDNSVSAAKALLDPELEDYVTNFAEVTVLQMWFLQDWCNDDVAIGIINGLDEDDDRTDNHSGTEAFDSSGSVDGEGHSIYDGIGVIADSVVSGNIADVTLNFGFVSLASVTPVYVEGTVSESEWSGVVGAAADVDDLGVYLESQGLAPELATVLADLDMDGDGENDAVSAGFETHAVPCTLD